MFINITENDAIDIFRARGRLDTGKGGNFTPDGVAALVEYMEQLEDDLGESIQFDPIGLCCQFSEYATAAEAVHDRDETIYAELRESVADDDDPEAVGEAIEDACVEWLQNETTVILFKGGIIIDSEF